MVKKLIRKVLNVLGYEIQKKNKSRDIFAVRQRIDEALVHLGTTGYYPELIIDVGAADGTPFLQKSFPKSRFFWIEPLKEFETALKNLQQTYNGDYAITAVGKAEGSLVLHVHEDLHGSTLFNETDGEKADGIPREIPVTTLNRLAAENNWKQYGKILLKADVQGFELEVLEGAKELLPQVDVILLEVSFFRFLKQAPDFFDVISYMKGIGYAVYDIVGGLNRPLDSALGQKDLVFVKENGIFRAKHGWNG